MTGRVLASRYELQSRLGRGGAGEVWLAHDRRLGRPVAVKLLHAVGPAHEHGATFAARMQREGRIAARLRHPNAVSVHDLDFDHDQPFVVMEYVPGEALSTCLDRGGPFAPAAAARIVGQVAAALAAAHELGITHRDVKPSNILLEAGSGQAKLADFGIARAHDDTPLTVVGQVLGTLSYLAPEVVEGSSGDAAGDMWSLGATFFAMVEGHPPHGGANRHLPAIMLARVSEPAPPAANGGPYAGVIAELLARDPARRPSARAVAERLAVVQGPGAPPPPGARRRRRRVVVAAAVAAVLVVAGVVVGGVLWAGRDRTPDPPRTTTAAATGFGIPAGYTSGSVTPDGRFLYAVGSTPRSVLVVDLRTFRARQVAIGGLVGDIVLDSGRVYVSVLDDARRLTSISVLDAASATRIGQIDVGPVRGATDKPAEVGELAVADGRLYVTTVGGVQQIDPGQGRVVRSIPIAKGLGSLAVSPDGLQLFIVGVVTHGVDIVDVGDGEVFRRIPFAGFAGGRAPRRGLVLSDDGTGLYAYGPGAGIGHPNSDTVLLLSARSGASSTVPVPANSVVSPLGLTPDGRTLYVTGRNDLLAIDTRAHTVRTIPLGRTPTGVCVTSDGRTVYAITPGKVFVLDR